jgi:hypothetical protein
LYSWHCLHVKCICLVFRLIATSAKVLILLVTSSMHVLPSVESLYRATDISGAQFWCFLYNYY